jgi:hypothetical protein
MNIIEIDDAIPKLYQNQIEAETTSTRMTWSFHEESARASAVFQASYGGFSHIAYHIKDQSPSFSPMTAMLLPMLFMFCEKARLEFNALLRIRLGLFPRNPDDVGHHNPHVDFQQPHQTAVYYVNDSDGDTVVFNETSDDVNAEQAPKYAADGKFTILGRVSPKKGRMMAFDGKHYHASMHPRKAASRVAITFNFV